MKFDYVTAWIDHLIKLWETVIAVNLGTAR
jgi:hypothetical protein